MMTMVLQTMGSIKRFFTKLLISQHYEYDLSTNKS